MENKESKTQTLFDTLLSTSGNILALIGLALIISKLFGYPYLFEGVVSFFLGIVVYYISHFNSNMLQILDSFQEIVEKIPKIDSLPFNSERQYPPGFGDLPHPQHRGFESPPTISLDENSTPEELDSFEEQFPHLKPLLDTLRQNSPINKEQDLKQLHIALQKAIDKDDFELAAQIRDKIRKTQD